MFDRLKTLRRLFHCLIAAAGFALVSNSWAVAGGVTIKSYGHSSLFIKGGGRSVLLNPFKSVGCASGLIEPRIAANFILASSKLADEGARIARGKFFVDPGSYRIDGMQLEGLAVPHDRLDGRRFGQATLWRWYQGGLVFVHLGSSASPLTGAERVFLGRPDVLIIGVGGGAKVYDGKGAANVVKQLNPKRVIPVNYVSGKAPANCDQTGVQSFLDAMNGIEVREVGTTLSLSSTMGNETVIEVMR